MVDSLWDKAGVCFINDDGSLPGIEISNLSPNGVSAVYAFLRDWSRPSGYSPEFWSRTREESVPVDSVSDAASLVVVGEAEAFHHCVEGVVVGGVELPILGVFVWPKSIELDYRMGPQWGPDQVSGFFELLQKCCSLDPVAVVVPAEYEGPPHPERFLQAWSAYKKHAESGD